MLLVVKRILFTGLLLLGGFASARDIHVLVLGDQLAANCHQQRYGSVPGVFLLGADGRERPAADPLEWSDCREGSMWMPLAARLKQQRGVDKVVLIAVAVSNAKAHDWLSGPASSKLESAISAIKGKGITIDYALWQQGIADAASPGPRYLGQMRGTVKSISVRLKIDKWLIAQPGNCLGKQLDHVHEAQRQFAQQNVLNRFPGASDANLSRREQTPDCRLTGAGQEVMAQRWFDAIQRADTMSKLYRKETLVDFFK